MKTNFYVSVVQYIHTYTVGGAYSAKMRLVNACTSMNCPSHPLIRCSWRIFKPRNPPHPSSIAQISCGSRCTCFLCAIGLGLNIAKCGYDGGDCCVCICGVRSGQHQLNEAYNLLFRAYEHPLVVEHTQKGLLFMKTFEMRRPCCLFIVRTID